MSNDRPAGWYPDGANTGQQRWWDGNQWTAQVSAPYQGGVGSTLRAPEGTSPNTVHIWLIVLLFVLSILASYYYLATFDFRGYMQASMSVALSGSTGAGSLEMLQYLFTPGYFILLGLSFLAYVGTIVLALLDAKALEARGVPKPFPWALSFIPTYGSLVYVIGRSVVARRRTGSGMAPMWVFLALFVASIIGSFVISFFMFADMMNAIAYDLPLYEY